MVPRASTDLAVLGSLELRVEDLTALAELAGALREPAVRDRLERQCVLPQAIDWLLTTTTELLESGRLPLWVSTAYAEVFLGTLGAVLDRLQLWGHETAERRDELVRIGRSWQRAIDDATEAVARATTVITMPAR